MQRFTDGAPHSEDADWCVSMTTTEREREREERKEREMKQEEEEETEEEEEAEHAVTNERKQNERKFGNHIFMR